MGFEGKKIISEEQLLKLFDKMNYNERIAYMVHLGRQCTEEEKEAYIALLKSWMAKGEYEARLALTEAVSIQDHEVILMAIKHWDSTIQCLGAKYLGRLGSTEEIKNALPRLSMDCLNMLVRSVLKGKRYDVAEGMINEVCQIFGVQAALKLLGICSKKTVSLWLDKVGGEIQRWKKITDMYPELVLAQFEKELIDTTEREKQAIWYRYWDSIEGLSVFAPKKMLAYSTEIQPRTLWYSDKLTTFARQYPSEVVKLLTCEKARNELLWRGIPHRLLVHASLLSSEQWIQIGRLLREKESRVTELLSFIAPAKRAIVFEGIYPKIERQNKVFTTLMLQQLPFALREAETVRMLGLKAIKDYPDQAEEIMACRTSKEASTFFEKRMSQSDVMERAHAITSLIQWTITNRIDLLETLQTAGRFKNDQDTVKASIMESLATCPAYRFKEVHIPALTGLVDSVVEACDLSTETINETQHLLFNIFRQNAKGPLFEFVTDSLIKIIKLRGRLTFPSFHQNMPKKIEKPLFEVLYPYLLAENKRENYQLTLDFASALDERAYGLTKLQELVRESISSKRQSDYSRGIALWLKDHRTRDERVKELLHEDPSYIKERPVLTHLHYKRQEWLAPFIAGDVIRGKLMTGQTIYCLPVQKGFFRWLPCQQETFCKLLQRIAYSDQYHDEMRLGAINAMSRMPAIDLACLYPLLQDKKVKIVEGTLRALSYTDRPMDVLKVLLEYLDKDEARVAMYTVGRCMRRIAYQDAFELLKVTLEKSEIKLTAKKEVIRLLGSYGNEESMKLLETLAKTSTHKDLLIAIGHGAKACLPQEGAWRILEQLAMHPDDNVARSLLQTPYLGTKAARKRYLEIIIKLTAHQDIRIVKEAFYTMQGMVQGNEERVARYASEYIASLKDDVSWRAAEHILCDFCDEKQVKPIIIDFVKKLIEKMKIEALQGEQERDLPARRRLISFMDRLAYEPLEKRVKMSALYMGLIEAMASEETLCYWRVLLAIAALDWQQVEVCRQSFRWMEKDLLQQPYLMSKAYDTLKKQVEKSRDGFEPEQMLSALLKLQEEVGAIGQYLSLAVLGDLGDRMDWQPECKALLIKCRQSQDLAVRTKACEIFYSAD